MVSGQTQVLLDGLFLIIGAHKQLKDAYVQDFNY
jgi:hypothetical protein